VTQEQAQKPCSPAEPPNTSAVRSAALSGLRAAGSGAELLAAQMVTADPTHAREIAGKLALDLLGKIQAGRRVDPVVREFVAALLRASRDTPPAMTARGHQVDTAAPTAQSSAGDDWLTVEQAAERLGKSRRTTRRLCAQGVVEARRFGRDWQIRASAVGQ
jgi:excisionase family DNA binding protein